MIENMVPEDTRNLITFHPERIDERLKRRVVNPKVSITLLKELQQPQIDDFGCFAQSIGQIQPYSGATQMHWKDRVRTKPTIGEFVLHLMGHVSTF